VSIPSSKTNFIEFISPVLYFYPKEQDAIKNFWYEINIVLQDQSQYGSLKSKPYLVVVAVISN